MHDCSLAPKTDADAIFAPPQVVPVTGEDHDGVEPNMCDMMSLDWAQIQLYDLVEVEQVRSIRMVVSLSGACLSGRMREGGYGEL